jgi:hypothetical protein
VKNPEKNATMSQSATTAQTNRIRMDAGLFMVFSKGVDEARVGGGEAVLRA